MTVWAGSTAAGRALRCPMAFRFPSLIALKRPFSDGTVAVDLDPLSLLCRLVALVPAPRFHTVRYFGVLAAASKWRPFIVPKPGPSQVTDNGRAPDAASPCSAAPCSASGSRY